MPFVSKQKGRMSALLKAKSKIKVQRKPRVQYDVGQSLKRIRLAPRPSSPAAGPNQLPDPISGSDAGHLRC